MLFIKTDRESFGKNDEKTLLYMYIAAHVLGHKISANLEKISYTLSEGFADNFARYIMHTTLLDELFPTAVEKNQSIARTDFKKSRVNNPTIPESNQLLFIASGGEKAMPFWRLKELQLFDKVKSVNSENEFKNFLRDLINLDVTAIKNHLNKAQIEDIDSLFF